MSASRELAPLPGLPECEACEQYGADCHER